MAEKRLPSLDGWRAVSILIVILGHQVRAWRNAHAVDDLFFYLDFSFYGVQIFFVISGFLITYLLVHEQRKHGSISFRNFYIRRAFRILPPLFAFLAVVFGLNLISGGGEVDETMWFKSIFFLMDFNWAGGVLGHIWSLSVEEQYYIFWPYIFSRSRLKLLIPVLFIVLAIVLRVLIRIHYIKMNRFFPLLNLDSIFVGALFAMYWDTKVVKTLVERANYLLGFTAMLMLLERFSVKYTGIVTVPLTHLCFALSVMLLIIKSLKTGSLLYKALNARPLVFIGIISYSLYLWQELFLFPTGLLPLWMTTFPYNVIILFFVAWLANRLVERPFLKLKAKYIS